jgi:hypothetical protein
MKKASFTHMYDSLSVNVNKQIIGKKGVQKSRNHSSSVLIVIFLISILVLFCFLYYDPKPDFLLSLSSSVNVIILLYSMYRLYKNDLLLSPLTVPIIGTAEILYYSIGNLGARIQGNLRYLANFGALDYYPLASLLSSIGLFLYSILGFYLFEKYRPRTIVRYQDFYWNRWKGLFSFLVLIAVMIYLQVPTHGFWAELSRFFNYAYRYLISLVIIVNTSIFHKEKNHNHKLIALMVLLCVLTIGLVDRSRTYSLMYITLLVMCWVTIKPKHVIPVVLLSQAGIMLFYSLGTIVKDQSSSGGPKKIIPNLQSLIQFNYSAFDSVYQQSLESDFGYRMAGFELPATILMNIDHGVPVMLGGTFLGAFYQSLPSYIRPAGIYSDRQAIYQHFKYRGSISDDEIMGIPLSSGLADFGILGGILIYPVMSVCYWLFWRLTQLSSKIYVAFLMIFPVIFMLDLFWGNFLASLKALGFSFLLLVLFQKLLMPIVENHEKSPGL